MKTLFRSTVVGSSITSLTMSAVLASAVAVVSFIVPSEAEARANCNNYSGAKRYRCDFTGGKWWKGRVQPGKWGSRTIHVDGQLWTHVRDLDGGRTRRCNSSTTFPIFCKRQFITKSNFLDRAATSRIIRTKDRTRMQAINVGTILYGISSAVVLSWINNDARLIAGIPLGIVGGVIKIGSDQWRWAADDGNKYNFDRGLCYYSVTKGENLVQTNRTVGRIRSMGTRTTGWGWYSNELTGVCR